MRYAECRRFRTIATATSQGETMSRVILALAGALLYVTPARADAPPAGSYLKTCSNPSVGADRVLRARCQNRQGASIAAALQLPCAGAIENSDGQLRCLPGSPPPQGSYLQTCTAARVQDGVLQASCRRINQAVVSASLRLPCGGRIENQDGRLLCLGATAPAASSPAAADPRPGAGAAPAPADAEMRKLKPTPAGDAAAQERRERELREYLEEKRRRSGGINPDDHPSTD